MRENIYCNTISGPKPRSKDEKCISANHHLVCIAVLFVSLFLSLLANAVLAYLHYNNWQVGCESVTNCSDPGTVEVENNAQNIWTPPKEMEDRTATHYCPAKDLPDKWVQDKGRFYVFSTEVQNWNSSRERCQALGGDLVIINSEEEQKFLAKQILAIDVKTLYWMGLTDIHTEGEFLWVDNTLIDLKFWAGTSPDNFTSPENPLGEDCVVLNGRMEKALWGDVSCLRKERRICEIPCA